MNILMISKIDLSRPTGETEHFLGLATGFTKLGHKVLLLCPNPSSKLAMYNGKVDYRFIPSTQSPFKSIIFQFILVFYMPILFLAGSINVVYIRQGPFLIIPVILSNLLGYFTVTEINGLLQEDMKILYSPPRLILRFSEICEKTAYLLSHKIISVTPKLGSFIKKKYKIKKSKIGVFSNGVDTDFYRVIKKKHNSFNVLFMGGSSKWQGIETLKEAIKIINSKGENINFIIISDKNYGKIANVKYFINVNRRNIMHLFPFIDIAVAPYTKLRAGIGSPIKIYTYLSGGIPVITSGIDEISFQIESYNAGLLIEPDNPKKLYNAIIFLYKNRETILSSMSENARLLAEKYDWKIVASKIIDFVYN